MMSIALTTDILLKSVGRHVRNAQGELLGRVVEISRSPDGDRIEYIILNSGDLFANSDRYFAIPVSSTLVQISTGGEIIIHISKSQLQKTNQINRSQCPRPDFSNNPPVFELFDYESPDFFKNK